MMLCRLVRSAVAACLAACLFVGAGCSAAGAVIDALSDEPPPGEARRPAPTPGLEASRSAARSSGGTSSTYLSSPALTWGALQLHRPHTIGGSLFSPGRQYDPECRRTGRLPFEVTGLRFSDPWSVLGFERPDGTPGTEAPVELRFSFDREIVSQRMLRSGAFLVERGPVCFESFFFYWEIGGRVRTLTSW